MRTVILAVTVLPLIVPARAIGQDALRLTPGTKVRVTAPTLGLRKQVGHVEELNGDTLIVQTKTGPRVETLHISIPAIRKLDVRTGRRSHLLQGAGVGVAAGTLLGLALGSDQPNQWFGFTAGEKALMGAVGGGLSGALVGVLVRGDKWEELPLDQVRPRLIAGEDGIGIGISLQF